MIKKPPILSSRLVYNGWLKLRQDEVQLCKMPSYRFDVVKVGDGDGVGVLPFLSSNKLLLSTQYRLAVDDMLLELIQGGAKKGEDPQEAAARELLEETGYKGALEYMTTIYPLPAALDMRFHIYTGRELHKVQEPALDAAEELLLVERPYQQTLEEVLDGKHKDSALVAALLHYALRHPSKG